MVDLSAPKSPGGQGSSGVAAGLPLPALLGLATRVVNEAVLRGLAAAGFPDIRSAHGYTFSLLGVRGGATGVEIAAHLGMTKQSAKVLVDQLEAGGYVRRSPSARDRRARVVQLTDRGWACIEAGIRLWAETEADLRAVVGPVALDAARLVLEELVRTHLGEKQAVPLRPPP